ncbi:glutamate--tRNA ligase [Haliovirga abyssi]|uniref:Glutamate--tRNA ligase n=1 Tax=Haliovirga abyssi TaxID=2996794 RepID=A0AAU9DMS8_9FUSO|nr:glutamate--tRNA ligase [Haliovirga abyssi]BDU51342.1 glutamate--tRNA ligase [Haliovirga abyssi]
MEKTVRFAPSPTGYLHIGGLRTALINFIYAEKNHGNFILRIEDTDRERSKKEYEKAITDALEWVGIKWDKFYRQSDDFSKYNKYFDKLIEENKAYRCFCNDKEDKCNCFNLSEQEVKKKIENSEKFTIKLKIPDKNFVIDDKIKGKVYFKKENFKDFIIRKSDGVPIYHFAVVIDDYEEGVSFVIRGEDHLSNTPKQVMIYEALELEIPEYGHLPLMLGEDKTRLSKRHGDVSIDSFQKDGILKESIINYLMVLGYSTDVEIFSFEDGIDDFDLSKMTKKATVFDYKKLYWFNKYYISSKNLEEMEKLFKDYLIKYGYLNIDEIEKMGENFKNIVGISKDKVSSLKELYELNKFFFEEIESYDEKGKTKFLEKEGIKENLKNLYKILENENWDIENLLLVFRNFAKENGMSLNKVVQPVRVLITGKTVSPGLFESMYYLGKEESLKRMERWINE